LSEISNKQKLPYGVNRIFFWNYSDSIPCAASFW